MSCTPRENVGSSADERRIASCDIIAAAADEPRAAARANERRGVKAGLMR